MRLLTIGDYAGPPIIPLDECKAHLRVDGSDSDGDIVAQLLAAQRAVSRESGLLLGGVTCRAVFDGFPDPTVTPGSWYPGGRYWPGGEPIELGVRPVSAVESVTYFDGAAWVELLPVGDWYRLAPDTGRVVPIKGWPLSSGPASVTVQFAAGLATLPAEARHAILLALAFFFENRGDEETRQALPLAAQRLCWHLHSGVLA